MAAKIMIVDDSSITRQMLNFTLQKAGYVVVEAVDGLDALRKFAAGTVQLLITDLNMPNMDGLLLIREVRKDPEKKFPIIVLSSESQEETMEKGREAGVAAWIVKPFQADQLLGVVQTVLQNETACQR